MPVSNFTTLTSDRAGITLDNVRTDVSHSPRLLPAELDHLAEENGSALYALYPKSRHLDAGFQPFTIAQLANAVDHVAYLLRNHLGEKRESKVVAFLGPNDVYTTVAFIAVMKAGYEIYMPSERNNIEAQLHLLRELKCTVVLASDPTFPAVQAIANASPGIEIFGLPTLMSVSVSPPSTYPFTDTIDSLKNAICFIVHTSGSTGFPKPVRIPFEAVNRMANCMSVPEIEGYQTMFGMIRGKVCIDLLPLNHPAGINVGILNAIYNRFTIVLPPPGMPPTARTLADMADHVSADWTATAPLTMEDLSKDSMSLAKVTDKLPMLYYSGGSLPKIFGDKMSSKVRLLSGLGSSETGPLPVIYPNDFDWVNDWEYLALHPALNSEFEPLPDSTHELIQRRSPESEPYQVAFARPGMGDVFRSRDIFRPHPTKSNLWTHMSRSDDVIVLINSEKVNPVEAESVIASHPKVAGALLFGAQRFEIGVLVEMSGSESANSTASERAQMLDDIWDQISLANKLLPTYGQISKSHVMFTATDEPIMRTAKNTVRRSATLDLYKSRIDKLYTDVEVMWVPRQATRHLSPAACKRSVRDAVRSEPNFAELTETDDFFKAGMDSLQVLRLIREIRKATSVENLDPSVVYQNSTIESLTGAIHELSRNRLDTMKLNTVQRDAQMRALVKDYTEKLGSQQRTTGSASGHIAPTIGRTIILTGSTGHIGRYVLRSLLKNPQVDHIYCLNRSADAASVQSQRNASTDSTLPTTFDEASVTFLSVDLANTDNFGLSAETYHKMVAEVTHVIHLAWPVDFNRSLPAFAPALNGLTSLLKLCKEAPRSPEFMFVSSISTTFGVKGTAPEEFIDDTTTCPHAGYSESKWIGESLCDYAASELGIPTSIVRLGQIAGAVGSAGPWNPSDWLPSLILSSACLSALPDRLPEGPGDHKNIRWLPIDTTADVLIDLLFDGDEGLGLNVYQPLNRNPISWQLLLESVAGSIADHRASGGDGKDIEIVPATEWLKRLRESGAAGGTNYEELLRLNPALKLQEHFEAQFSGSHEEKHSSATVTTFDSSRALKKSVHLREAVAVSGEDMKRWIGQWFALSKSVKAK